MISWLERVNQLIWGVPALLLILLVGIYLTLRTRFLQFRSFPEALRRFLSRFCGSAEKGEASGYRSLCTALAATVGTGNLAGVAGAICLGGPGAIFWMWICGLLGMVIKFAEATLAIRYRTKDADGTTVGGTMYMIKSGMQKQWHWLAGIYCFFGVVASLGVGNATQVSTMLQGISAALSRYGIRMPIGVRIVLGILLGMLICCLLKGGTAGVGAAAELLVPFAAVVYLFIALLVIFIKIKAVPAAFGMILTGAFSPGAVTGGVIGSCFCALRVGAARGVFTNEAGMGTASIAHASANVEQPWQQGLLGIMEVFIDTILICTMTALVILCSGVSIPYGQDAGMNLTERAFSGVLGNGISVVLSVCLCLFAFATLLGWGFYGLRCGQFLFGDASKRIFPYIHGAVVVVAALLNTETLWLVSEIVNGLMCIPNLIVLLALSPELVLLTK